MKIEIASVEYIPKTANNKFHSMPATSSYGSALCKGKTREEALKLANEVRLKEAENRK